MQKHILVIGTSTVAFAAGAAAGFLFAKAKLQQHYEDIANDEIAEAQRHLKKKFSGEKQYKSPQDAVEALISDEEDDLAVDAEKALKEYQGEIAEGSEELQDHVERHSFERTTERVVERQRNIFSAPPTPQAAVQFNKAPLDEDAVEIVSMEDYLENVWDHEQVTFTYFEGDQVLVGAQDQEVQFKDSIVTENALQFGNKSDDKNVVYIRNKKIGVLFEVLRHEGKASEIVHGIEVTDDEEE